MSVQELTEKLQNLNERYVGFIDKSVLLEKVQELSSTSSQTHSNTSTRSVQKASDVTTLCGEEKCFINKKPIILKQCHFKEGKTVRITCPGKYVFGENIVFNPSSTGISALEINSDNVVLDLNCCTLSQGNKTSFVAGVLVTEGHQNVTITGGDGGAVFGFSQFGVRVEGDTSEVTISDLLVEGNGFNSGVSYVGVFFAEFGCTPGLATGGLAIGNAVPQGLGDGSKLVHNLRLHNVRALRNDSNGALLLNITGADITDSSFSENFRRGSDEGLSFAFAQCTGVNTTVCIGATDRTLGDSGLRNATFTNCHFDRNNWTGNANNFWATGYSCLNVEGTTIDRCTFNGNYASTDKEDFAFASSNGLRGAHWYGSNKITNSQFNENNLTTSVPGGAQLHAVHITDTMFIRPRDASILVENCEANNNTVDVVSLVNFIGFVLQWNNNVTFKNVISNKNVVKAQGGGYVGGLVVAFNDNSTLEKSSVVETRNLADIYSEAISVGAYDSVVLDGCCSQNNTVPSETNPFDGFWVDGNGGGRRQITIQNCVSDGNGALGASLGDGFNLFGDNNGSITMHFLNNLAKNNGNHGVNVAGRGTDEKIVLKHNILSNNQIGLEIGPGVKSSVVTDNCIDNNAAGGIVNKSTGASLTTNNTLFNNGVGLLG